MDRRHFTTLALAAASKPALAAKPPATWDGLVRVKSKKFKLVYLAPSTDFRAYTKVMLDPTEIAFQKDWQRSYNDDALSVTGRLTDKDLQAKAYAAGGYPVVDAAAADVLRVRTGLVDITVSAPDRDTPGIARTYAPDAGGATVVVEARDSMTGALLGRAVDSRTAGDLSVGDRNRVTNRADFGVLVEAWAKNSVKGLDELKTLSPIKPGDEAEG